MAIGIFDKALNGIKSLFSRNSIFSFTTGSDK